jgi:cytohesin
MSISWTFVPCLFLSVSLPLLGEWGPPSVHDLVRKGDLPSLRARVEENPGLVRATDGFSRTPLHTAAMEGDRATVEFLISRGADPLALDRLGFSATALARNAGHEEIAEVLASAAGIHHLAEAGDNEALGEKLSTDPGAVNQLDAAYNPPLYYAIRGGHLDTVKLLVGNGAVMSASCSAGTTPLHTAAKFGQSEITEWLLSQGVVPGATDTLGRLPSQIAESEGYRDLAVLLAPPLSVWKAAETGDLDRLKSVATADPANVTAPDENGNTPLLLAVVHGRASVVRWLIEQPGAPVGVANAKGETPLIAAVQSGNREVLNLLIAAGADPGQANQEGRTPLFFAARQGDAEAVAALIEAGAPVQTFHDNGLALLEVAAIKGNERVVDRLIAAGAPVNVTSPGGRSPLYWAIKHGFEPLARKLEGQGAILHSASDTALHRAIGAGDLAAFERTLSELPTLLSQKNSLGWSPLHLAARKGNPAMVQKLLSLGADPKALDDMGKPPLYWAQRERHSEVAALLEVAEREAGLQSKSQSVSR